MASSARTDTERKRLQSQRNVARILLTFSQKREFLRKKKNKRCGTKDCDATRCEWKEAAMQIRFWRFDPVKDAPGSWRVRECIEDFNIDGLYNDWLFLGWITLEPANVLRELLKKELLAEKKTRLMRRIYYSGSYKVSCNIYILQWRPWHLYHSTKILNIVLIQWHSRDHLTLLWIR